MNYQELKQACDRWIDFLIEDEKSENSIKQYRRALDVFLEYLKEQEITEIDKKTVINYKKAMIEEVKKNQATPAKPINGKRPLTKMSTVNMRIRTLNALFKFLKLDDLTVKREKDESQNYNDDMLTNNEMLRLLETAKSLGKEKIYMIMKTLSKTGARISELEYLTVESLKTRKPTITNKGKTRLIFIPKKLAGELKEYCKANGIKSGIIFSNRDGSSLLDQTYIRSEIKEIARKTKGIKLSKAHPHNFRHWYAQNYANMPSANPYILPMLLGHSDKGQTNAVTALYVKPKAKDMLRIVDNFERYIDDELKKEQVKRNYNRKQIQRRNKKK